MTEFHLVHQWGVRVNSGEVPDDVHDVLNFPGVVALTPQQTYLIVDRGRPMNKLIEVAADGQVISCHSEQPRMNWAHRRVDGTTVMIQSSSVHVLDRDGRRDLLRALPTQHQLNCGDVRGDLIAIGCDDGIFLLASDGRLIRHLRPDESTFIEPADIQILPDGSLLVTDGWMACVVELDPDGRRTGMFGKWRQPGIGPGRLAGPLSACRLPDGRTIVADWRAHRLVEFEPDGERNPLPPAGARDLFGPTYVRATPDGDLLVAEAGSRRVHRRTQGGDLVWGFGSRSTPERTLSFPRSAHLLDTGELLVCDSYANRLVIMDESGSETWAFGAGSPAGSDAGITVPRSASPGPGGVVAIADGLNSRVLVVDRSGRTRREIGKVTWNGRTVRLADPHQVEVRPDGLVLVLDSDLNQIMLIDDNDDVVTQWGGDSEIMNDPHQAWLLPHGGILVADSGNNRIIELDAGGNLLRSLSNVHDDAGPPTPLDYPRCVEPLRDGTLLIVDSGSGRILRAGFDGTVAWSIGPVLRTERLPYATRELRVPRWATSDGQGMIVVTDFVNCRVAAFRPVMP